VVASMFEQVDADILVMVDGDDTYDAAAVGALLEPILKGDADMTVAARLEAYTEKSFRHFICWQPPDLHDHQPGLWREDYGHLLWLPGFYQGGGGADSDYGGGL